MKLISSLSIMVSKREVSSKMPLAAGMDPISSADRFLAVVNLEPDLIYARLDFPNT